MTTKACVVHTGRTMPLGIPLLLMALSKAFDHDGCGRRGSNKRIHWMPWYTVTCCTVAMVWSSILRMAWCTVTYSIVWIIRAIRSHIVSCGCYGIRSDIVLPYRYYGIQSHIVFCGCHGIQSHAVLCGRLSKRPHIVSRVDAIVYGFILHRVDAIVYGHILPVWMPCLVIIM